MDEEIERHLELRIRENLMAGMSEEQARWAARRAFGNPVLTREDSRGAWRLLLLETTLQDVRYGARTLVRSPLFSLAVVLTLALGIGANTAIFSFLDAVVLRNLPVPRPDELHAIGVPLRIGMIQTDGFFRDGTLLSCPMFGDLREHADVFSDLAAVSSFPVGAHLSPDDPSSGAQSEKVTAYLVSGNFFEVLGVRAEVGRMLTGQDGRTPGADPVVVVSDGFWARRFGRDPKIVGRDLRLNGLKYTIIGVAASGFSGVTVGDPTDAARWTGSLLLHAVSDGGPVLLKLGLDLRVLGSGRRASMSMATRRRRTLTPVSSCP